MSFEKYLDRIPPVFKSRLFVAILAVKIIASFLFGSDFLVKGFLPFIQYFVSSGFHDPYLHFASMGAVKAFPYPTVMLGIVSFFYAIFYAIFSVLPGFMQNLPLQLFIMRLPILICDIFIFYVLARWLKTQEQKVLNYYWASPILFYISYFHGQLDAIPIAVLFLSLVLIFRGKNDFSAVALGAGIATKTNILLALPFIAIYLWKNNSMKAAMSYVALAVLAYIVLIFPFISSPGFTQMVFRASENFRVLDLGISLGFNAITILAAPAILLIIIFHFASYEKTNRDLLLTMLALVFTVVVTIVPPAPGWYFWAVPFLTYFFVRQEKFPMFAFWAANAFYLAYFLLSQNSDIFQSFQPIAPQAALLPNPHAIMLSLGIDAASVSNLLFTALAVSLAMIAHWTYTIGVKSNLEYRKKDKPVVIGIGGDSGAGKSTYAELLKDIFGDKSILVVNGDDMHKWERGNENWKVFTHLNPEANKLHEELEQAIALTEGNRITRCTYDHSTGKFTEPAEVEPNKFILFVGLHPFYLKRMRDIYALKIYMDPQEELKLHWKIARDMVQRGYTKEQVLMQLKKRKDDKSKFIEPQKQFADVVISYSLRNKLGENEMGSSSANLDICLKVLLDNSIDLKPLERALSFVKTLSISCNQKKDLRTQECEFYGSITGEELEVVLHKIVPNFEELLHNASPKFKGGYYGISQLLLVYCLSETSKLKVS